jgi:hypothetical protein
LGLNVDYNVVECGTTCAPGDLVNRSSGNGSKKVVVSGNMINSDIKVARSKYDMYTGLASVILELDELANGGYNLPKYPK